LSGGQTEEEATINLDAINRLVNKNPKSCPWNLSFSYGRALQATCISTWAGKEENVEKAREVLLHRAKSNSEAQLGKYQAGEANIGSKVSLFEKDYIY
jgi:fructose-bisphosphate aldolase class I